MYSTEAYLTKVGAFFRDSKVTLLIGASEKSGVGHVRSILVVSFPSTNANPEEVLRFLSFSYNLKDIYYLILFMSYIIHNPVLPMSYTENTIFNNQGIHLQRNSVLFYKPK